MNHIITFLRLLHILGSIFLLVGNYLKIPYIKRKHLWEVLGNILFLNNAMIYYHRQHRGPEEQILNMLEFQVAWLIYSSTYQYIANSCAGTQVIQHAYIVMFWIIHHLRLVNNGIFLTILFNWLSLVQNCEYILIMRI